MADFRAPDMVPGRFNDADDGTDGKTLLFWGVGTPLRPPVASPELFDATLLDCVGNTMGAERDAPSGAVPGLDGAAGGSGGTPDASGRKSGKPLERDDGRPFAIEPATVLGRGGPNAAPTGATVGMLLIPGVGSIALNDDAEGWGPTSGGRTLPAAFDGGLDINLPTSFVVREVE